MKIKGYLSSGLVMIAVIAIQGQAIAQQGSLSLKEQRLLESITPASLEGHLEFLASDDLMGRSTPSPVSIWRRSISPPSSNAPASSRRATTDTSRHQNGYSISPNVSAPTARVRPGRSGLSVRSWLRMQRIRKVNRSCSGMWSVSYPDPIRF